MTLFLPASEFRIKSGARFIIAAPAQTQSWAKNRSD
jgi:hypothetical protein